METISFAPGQVILRKGEAIRSILVISNGSIQGSSEKGDLFLSKGDVPAVFDLFDGISYYTYTAAEPVVCLKYPFQDAKSLGAFLKSSPDICTVLAASACKQCCSILDDSILQTYNAGQFYNSILDLVRNYNDLCARYGITPKTLSAVEELTPFNQTDSLPDYLSSYYDSIRDLPSEVKNSLFKENPGFAYGFLHKTAEDIHTILEFLQLLSDYQSDYAYLLLNRNGNDLFDLYTSLIITLTKKREDTMSLTAELSKLIIQMEGQRSIELNLYQSRLAAYKARLEEALTAPPEDLFDPTLPGGDGSLSSSVMEILEYGDYPSDSVDSFLEDLSAYKKLSDKSSSDEMAASLRRNLTKAFYELYTPIFQYSLRDSNPPLSVKMFLLFGFIDEELAGAENTKQMETLADELFTLKHSNIYTLYSWLRAIYEGKKDPSRNEFDADYTQYLHELRVSSKIDAEMEKRMLNDPANRVMYELSNMFPSVNKITCGRISTFCPFFSENNCIHSPMESISSVEKIKKALNFVRSIDYRCFYRDSLFTLPEAGINHENLSVEILPDIILMPNTGTRAALWQEIEGRKRTTPSRMMLPILCQEDITALTTRIAGEFRWEMCKRVQGSRWNDVSDPSLTSEYFDYIQFYRKNSELSPDAKEKIKTGLARAKNSYKEMFIRDYVQWIYYEGAGSPRLNKVIRKILFKYIPFPKSIREKLAVNPMYKECLDYFRLHNGQHLHRMQILCKKIENSGIAVPDAIRYEITYLQM